MVSVSTWLRYIGQKLEYSLFYSIKVEMRKYIDQEIPYSIFFGILGKNFSQGKMTFLHHLDKGSEMSTAVGETLLVRKLPLIDKRLVFVGDVVMVKDPVKPDDYLVRRLSAVEGYEMVSNDEKDKPFNIEKDECWVLSDNEALNPKEAKDSRTFGPFPMTDIVGRVIYSYRTAADHGPVQNSEFSMKKDSSIISAELDFDEMARNHKV